MLRDNDYQELVLGYIDRQFQEWLALKSKIYVRLDLNNDRIDGFIEKISSYLLRPLLDYATGRIDYSTMEKQVRSSIQFVMRVFTSKSDQNPKNLSDLTEFFFMFIKRIFLDFESPQEFKALLEAAYLFARKKEVPPNKIFASAKHYNAFMKKRYSRRTFEQKLQLILSPFSAEKLAQDYQFADRIPRKEFYKIYWVIQSVILERTRMIYPSIRA